MNAPTLTILQGDVIERLRDLPAESVQCAITSPPYWALRDYGVEGQIGLEPTPEAHIEKMVEVFREVWRVLRKDGTLWLNYGDCYACAPNGRSAADTKAAGGDDRTFRDKPISTATSQRKREFAYNTGFSSWSTRDVTVGASAPGLKPKDLVGMPWRLALALQADGWWLRSALPWLKRNAMPESAPDRPSTALEYVFLLTRSGDSTFWVHRDGKGSRKQPAPDYRWVNRKTQEEVAEEPAERWYCPKTGEEREEPPEGASDWKRIWQRMNLWEGHDYFWDADAVRRAQLTEQRHFRSGTYTGGNKSNSNGKPGAFWKGESPTGRNLRNSDFYFDSLEEAIREQEAYLGHLRRLHAEGGLLLDEDGQPVALDINPEPLKEKHFASFPTRLVKQMVMSSTSEAGACAACGAPRRRVVEKRDTGKRQKMADGWDTGSGGHGTVHRNGRQPGKPGVPVLETITAGWAPTCACAAESVPCTVLDPFFGSGTVGEVALRLGRSAVGIELNPEYVKLAERRCRKVTSALPLWQAEVEQEAEAVPAGAPTLFGADE